MKPENNASPLKRYEELLIKDFEAHSLVHTNDVDDEFVELTDTEMNSIVKKRKFVILKPYELEKFLKESSKKSKPRLLDFKEFNEFLENAN